MPTESDEVIAEKLARLPKGIYEFIYDDNDEDTWRIFSQAKLAFDQKVIVKQSLKRVYIHDLPVGDLYAELKKSLQLPEDTLKKFVRDLIGYRLLPIDDFLGGTPAALMALGAKVSDYPPKRIVMRALSAQDIVTELLHEHPVNVPAFLEHRLREILESRVREVRKDPETIARLIRAEKIGGVELPQEEAEQLVEALASKIASVKIASDIEMVPAPPDGQHTMDKGQQPVVVPLVEVKPLDDGKRTTENGSPTTNNQQPITRAAARQGDAFMPQDEHEAEAIRQNILPKIVSSALFDQEAEIKVATDAIFAASGASLPANLKERYRTIIASRLKGVRDPAETQDLLVREPGNGGMGFGSELADRLAREIEQQTKIIMNKRENAVAAEKQNFVKQTINDTFAKDESRRKGELEEIERMYGSLTGRLRKVVARTTNDERLTTNTAPVTKPVAINPQPVTPAPMPRPAPLGVKAPAAQIPNSNNPTSLPLRGAGQIPATVIAKAVPAPVVKAVAPPPPAAPAPHVAYKPQPLVPAAKMQDIRAVVPAAARLTGPAEELKNMTLIDFRRLSADPVEACRKLVDKLDVLEEHSYGKRIEGIKAWKESEVYKMYLQVINAAFSGGKAISAAIADAQSANAVTLTEREVHAIMELNNQLKA